jgi:asparagine synthetase B (glutamine-hydrolysing)
MFQYVLAQEIRNRGIDIVISGEWSDEIFYWYKRFYEWIKNTADIDMYYNDFFEKVFFYTLLQRLDRSFSHFTIEGRVPFLDQELVHGIRNTHISEKLQDQDDKYLLRKYALSIWIPKTIVYRKKEKMTRGITSQENNYTNNLNGYLENICFHKHSSSLSDICLTYYKKYFYHQWKDLHKNRKLFLREEDII